MDVIPSRPFSRLSTVSSFFSSPFGGRIPSRISNKPGLNFSRPIRRPTSPQADALSIRSYPKSRWSSISLKSTKAGRHSVSSRKSGKSSQRYSTAVLPSLKEENENTEGSDAIAVSREVEQQLMTEWIRHSLVDNDERQQNKRKAFSLKRSSWQGSMGGTASYQHGETVTIGPPPPRRSLAPIPYDKFISSPRSTLFPTQSSFGRYDGPYPLVASSYERSTDLSPILCLNPAGKSFGSTLPRSDTFKPDVVVSSGDEAQQSISQTRRSVGKFVPQLYLSREAISPSLWIADKLLNQFEGSERSGETEVVTEKALISSFSAETIGESLAPETFSGSNEGSPLKQAVSEGGNNRTPSSGTYCTRSSLSIVPLSPAPPSLSVSSVTSSLMNDESETRIGLAYRSAVTP